MTVLFACVYNDDYKHHKCFPKKTTQTVSKLSCTTLN